METDTPSQRRGRTDHPWASTTARLRELLGGSSADARLSAIAVAAFLGVAVWWLATDTRVPDFDSGKHVRFSFVVHDTITAGTIFKPFTEFDSYPPLGHLIGALGTFVGGLSSKAVILALAIVFVPALAIGCYGVGRRVGGTRAGLLAVLFALGAPMIVSESHEAYLDPLQAAMVALSVFAIIASDRFERVRVAALAGAASGLAFLAKETTPIFLAGLLIVVVARGGWKNWRGLLAYSAALGVIGGPWYLYHAGQLGHLVGAVNTAAPTSAPNQIGALTPQSRFSFYNLSWYFWDAANIQLRAPLLLLALAGTVAALRSSIRDRSSANIYPELLAGAVVSYVGITLITLKDARYTLPALVYLAVLSTAWIATLRPPARPWLTAALLAAVAASFAGVAFGVGGHEYRLRFSLPGAYPEKPPEQRSITAYSTVGWLRGPPETGDGNVLALLRGLRHEGVRAVAFCCTRERPEVGVDGGAERPDFNVSGLRVVVREARLKYQEHQAALAPRDVFLAAHAPIPGAPPCQRLRDGTGIYAVLGNPIGRPFSRYTFICPGRAPPIYGYRATS
jgi:Dolichyl-phosphate-mannose-protein mannosyltransferase